MVNYTSTLVSNQFVCCHAGRQQLALPMPNPILSDARDTTESYAKALWGHPHPDRQLFWQKQLADGLRLEILVYLRYFGERKKEVLKK